MLRRAQVPLLQRDACQNAQVIHREGMLLKSQPPRVSIGDPGGIRGFGHIKQRHIKTAKAEEAALIERFRDGDPRAKLAAE